MNESSNEDIMRAVIAGSYSVRRDALKLVEPSTLHEEYIKWGRLFCAKKQCYSNALSISELEEMDYVLGYVYLEGFGMAIEHAWNCNHKDQHIDMTAALFWERGEREELKATYFELVRLSHKEAISFFERFGGLHHFEILKSGEYNERFHPRLVSFYANNKKVS